MGKYLELICEDNWEYVVRKNCSGVSIVLVYNKSTKKYLVIEQYRIPIKERILEFPAGLIENGETPLDTALRELREEVGLVTTKERLINLGEVYSSAGLTNEKAYFYAVIVDKDVNFVNQKLDPMEIKNELRKFWISEDELVKSKAAKVLAILMRFKYKIKDENI
ncbi:MAG: NUDIX hydrolase [Deferribacterota bacterium]|nr:NUDIX hydrolase [Deferribacterota bacterium]